MEAIAKCTCRKCKMAFDKKLYESGSGASRRLQDKVAWAENGGIDLCTDCWKAEKREQEKAAGLICRIHLSHPREDQVAIWGVFEGDTYSHKDEIKALGAKWTDHYPTDGMIGLLALQAPPMRWALKADTLEDVEDLAKSVNAKIVYPDGFDLQVWAMYKNSITKEA